MRLWQHAHTLPRSCHVDFAAQARHHDGCYAFSPEQANGTDRELAQQYGIGVDTVRKWRHRSTVHDTSHTTHRLQTTLNAAQEELEVYLRTQLLPLDDLLAVVREFIEPEMSRSALDRLLRRRGHSRLPVPPKPDDEHKPFKAYEPGYVHIDASDAG